MYEKLPNLIIGFHGCDKKIYKKVLHKNVPLKPSKNEYDWLGNGMYFWEHNLERAFRWAENTKKIEGPAVIGAVIDLGNCLNLLDSHNIILLKNQFTILKKSLELEGKQLPENRGSNQDYLLRNLDCAVIESLHSERVQSKESAFDSVRGVFLEGKSIYEKSGFREKSHIQICVRNPNCIKGFFSPCARDDSWCLL